MGICMLELDSVWKFMECDVGSYTAGRFVVLTHQFALRAALAPQHTDTHTWLAEKVAWAWIAQVVVRSVVGAGVRS